MNASASEEKVSDCTVPSPTGLGNPASMLPFLTAQASSVLSMAAGSPGGFSSTGSVLTPAVDLLTGSEQDPKQPASGLPLGLDLGHGWKVVGLTSLADLPLQTSTQIPQSISVDSSRSGSGTQDTSSLINPLSETASLNKSGCTVNAPPILSTPVPGEWKVVGLTSLNTGNSDVLCNSKTATLSDQSSTLSDYVPRPDGNMDSSENDARAKGNEQSEQSNLGNNPINTNLFLPSLADVAAGTSDWKIAGVTTLVPSVDAAFESDKPHTSHTDMVRPVLPPVTAPEVSLADAAKWKVVGVTSLTSPSTNSAPVVASSNTQSPLILPSVPPVVPMPISPSADKEMVWKVVGMVPLQPQGETSPQDAEPSVTHGEQSCSISESDAQIQSYRRESKFESQTPVSSKCLEDSVRKAGMSSKGTEGRKWVSRCLDRREDPSHPLGFLKNCSNQFRNAVLKRNTVSTMLELKRAYQDMHKKEKLLNFMEGMNHLTLSKNLMYFALKRLSKSRSKSVDYDDFMEQNSGGLDFSPPHQNLNLRDSVQDSSSDTDDEMFCTSYPRSPKQMFMNQSTPSAVADDKLALSMAYEVQMKSERKDMLKRKDIPFLSTPPHPQIHGEESRENRAPTLKHPMFADDAFKSETTDDRQSVMNSGGYDNDAVNLTNIDPWGVCTSDDLGDIAEMVTEKEESRIHHSSSRKRKLTTPRKMIQ
ncbi:hypothetical protein ACOMHN_029802 [Nucella lapillus]